MRFVVAIAALAALVPMGAAQAADCGALKIVDRIQMTRSGGANVRDLIPVLVNGQPKNFLFDTGGEVTQISRAVATDMNLPIRQGNMQMVDMTGKVSRDQASLQQFQIGRMRGKDVQVPVSPTLGPQSGVDGILAPEVLRTSDVDIDFGTDTLNLFSQDHCDGAVIYWKAPVVATVPIVWHGTHMIVPVTLDGRVVRAEIDTGASGSTLLMETTKGFYNLTMGDADTPEVGDVNGDASVKRYGHIFKDMSFGAVVVSNPHISIIPNVVGRNLDPAQLVGDRTKSEKDLYEVPDMIIGMDVLRKLHLYFAVRENHMYVSEASVPAAVSPAAAP